MSKHFFHESRALGDNPQFYRIIFCEWCGLVAWDFNRTEKSVKELQSQVGNECPANKKLGEEK